MAKEKNMDIRLLLVAIVAIVALVAMTMFFSNNSKSTQTGNAALVDSAILDENLAGNAISTCQRDCLHKKCDSSTNQRTCVVNSFDDCDLIC